MAERIEEEVKQLRADLATLRGDVGKLLDAIGEEGARKAHDVRDSVAEDLRAKRDAVRRQIAASRARGRESIEELGDMAHEHPLGSMAVAFTMGFIASKLLDLGVRR